MNLKKIIFTAIFTLLLSTSFAQRHKLIFETPFGNFKVKLYDFTPRHRDLILSSIKDSTYSTALFNRIIKNFVVQGGEHDTDIAKREENLEYNEKKRLKAEFSTKAIHKIGALGMGRDENPDKASFLNQIYFVVGKNVTLDDLKKIESKKGFKYSNSQVKQYLKYGGLPRLDNDYTVFGEIYEGLDVILKISNVQTDSLDYPLSPISFTIRKINK